MFARIALRAMFIALATLPAAGALVASADDGPPRRPDATGRPAGTVLRPIRPVPLSGAASDTSSFAATPRPASFATTPVPAPDAATPGPASSGATPSPASFAATPGPASWGTTLRPASAGARELVLFVGGLSSAPDDGTFDVLAGRLAGDPRYEVRRFGADPRHPYDTRKALDPSADALISEIRERAPAYSGVHLITHSMGGAVVDRAFSHGLSSRDGLRTVVSLAPPRSGSALARTATGVLDAAGDEGSVVRTILFPVSDLGVPAVRDLARVRAVATPDGVTRLDLRLATDELVLTRDTAAPGTDSRTLLPVSASGLEGHGGILRDPRALDLVTATIARGRPPVDDRSSTERALTNAVSSLNDGAVALALSVIAAALLAFVVSLRVRRLWLPVVITPLVPRLWSWR